MSIRRLAGMGAALSLLLVGGLATPVLAQSSEDAQVARRMEAHVTFLAHDALEGRDTGSRGYELAALYVESHFFSLGLTPAGNAERTSWRQPVNFAEISLSAGQLSWTGPDGTAHSWSQGDGVALMPSQVGDVALDTGFVFVGYGLDVPSHGLDDYAGLDVEGKVVLALYGMPEGLPSELAAHLGSAKATTAFEHGAVGYIMIHSADTRNIPWSALMGFFGEPQTRWATAEGVVQGDAPGIKVEGFLSQPTTAMLFEAADQDLTAIQNAAAAGTSPKGFEIPGAASVSLTAEARYFTSPNIVAMLPGSDPSVADEVVIVLAHLDHVGISDDESAEDRISNGAMDNASGIATMIEVARALSLSDERPRRSVMFLAVTGEELGLLGSSRFAADPTVPLEDIVGVVNLDMPILTYDFVDVVAFGADHSTLGAIVAAATAEVGVATVPDSMPEENLFVRSDHYEFVKVGVPSVFLATGPGGEGAVAVADFLENHYHQVSDQSDLPFDWNAAARFVRVNTSIARTIADGEDRPMWYEGDEFGDLFDADGPRATRP
ncbi:MAG: M20/M25/M40 family metallo-hydrolase [Brevundimonas sp.]|uniref:M20/M25/M40 family metallo-hydrolase n=1 Tax=Brevundimonas sp. TaxID=1871086 RepID=UPI002ABCB142|nr:M20/M25/M40 family metallo-hydrolase [Brevundimonas sp.]MDZ4114117.1 M20/M25/M40 family metallo-hydrolase [Brevundimonas sp.]